MRSAQQIEADLEAAYEARREALLAQAYSLDTGQGRQQVSKVNIKDINDLISDLEAELSHVQNGGGLRYGRFRRF